MYSTAQKGSSHRIGMVRSLFVCLLRFQRCGGVAAYNLVPRLPGPEFIACLHVRREIWRDSQLATATVESEASRGAVPDAP